MYGVRSHPPPFIRKHAFKVFLSVMAIQIRDQESAVFFHKLSGIRIRTLDSDSLDTFVSNKKNTLYL